MTMIAGRNSFWFGRNKAAARAFTVVESVAALAIVATAMTLVAQLGVWHLSARARNRDLLAAQELVANVLESARASSWDELTPAWAAARHLPPSFADRD